MLFCILLIFDLQIQWFMSTKVIFYTTMTSRQLTILIPRLLSGILGT